MDWMEILKQIFEVCIIPLLGILTVYIVRIIDVKKEELKEKTDNALAQRYIDLLAGTIRDCVVATNQTYVDALKEAGEFDVDAQKEAFKRTYEAVMEILADDAKDYLEALYGNLESYVTNRIESEVKAYKDW